jgi:subtilase family serine protease
MLDGTLDRRRALGCLAGACAWLFFSGALGAQGRQVLRGHRNGAMDQAPLLGDEDPSAVLRLAVGLPHRNAAELAALLKRISDPRSPQYRHYLKPQAFAQRFGPSAADYEAVKAYLRGHGLRVVGEHANRAIIDVEGRAGDVQGAFNVRLRRYRRPEGGSFRAPDAEPSLDLDAPVSHITGLDDLARMTVQGQVKAMNQISAGLPRGGSGPGGLLLGSDFRNAYAPGVTLDGSGQSVALVELSNYFPADVAAYQALAGLSTTVQPIYLDGASAAMAPTIPDNLEPTMDIDMVCAMAPQATVQVYIAPNSNSSLDDILNQIACDGSAQQVSSSWIKTGVAPLDPLELQAEQQFAAQGQTYFRASGDDGAEQVWTSADMNDPLATLVGGTDLTMTGNGAAWASETVWNDATGASQGGVLAEEPIPDYQAGLDMTACQGSTVNRNYPDVAAVACNIFFYYNNGTGCSTGGTSAASPLWAGFMALVSQRCGQLDKAAIGFANPALYQLAQGGGYGSQFHGISGGDNGYAGVAGFPAVPGYNLCTGWGSMTGQPLIDALVDGSVHQDPTPVKTATPTVTPTVTVTGTATPSPTVTPSFTATPTASPSASPTVTLSPTPPATKTATLTPSPSPTVTCTPTIGYPLLINHVHACPNPGPDAVLIDLAGPCDRVDLKLYSEGFQQVAHQEFGPQSKGWARLELAGAIRHGLPRGVYFCTVTAHRGWAHTAPAFEKVMILR